MSKTHKIKSNERLFNQWLKASASPHTKLGLYGATMVQNDMEMTSDQLNEWYTYTGELIKETEKHFADVIKELYELRQQTVDYIKKINE